MGQFEVTAAATRPASDVLECFYCQTPIGGHHKPECVLISKKVKIRMTLEYEVTVPASWHKGQIEFHRNEGGWCADNALDELADLTDAGGCLCGASRFEYLQDASDPFLNEKS